MRLPSDEEARRLQMSAKSSWDGLKVEQRQRSVSLSLKLRPLSDNVEATVSQERLPAVSWKQLNAEI